MAEQTVDVDLEENWSQFFSEAVDILNQYEQVLNSSHSSLKEIVEIRLENLVLALQQTLPFVTGSNRTAVEEIIRNVCLLYRHLKSEASLNSMCTNLAIYCLETPQTIASGRAGRPRFSISEEVLLQLRSSGFTWKSIAKMLLVSRWTIRRRVVEYGLQQVTGFSDITDDELDNITRLFMRDHGRLVGYSLIAGHFKSLGLRIQRDRVRASIARVDPNNARIRWAVVIYRRSYNVAGPNSLWHIDGHHSLVTWGFVVHGGIDGFSRLIVFLKCSTNNKSETVTEQFISATNNYQWPSRVRSDYGGENVGVWQLMEEHRGPNRGSYIAGTSTQNQRIERLWRDVFRCIAHIFYYTFQAMEETGLLDRNDTVHLFVLHYVFLPRINNALDSFREAWNNHPIRTEHNWSPVQIWMNGMIDLRNQHLTAVADVAESTLSGTDFEWYGFDPQAPHPAPDDDGLSSVYVDDIEIDITEALQEHLINQVNPMAESASYGIDLYQRALEILQSEIN